jgi:aminoglycoside phosphotransferase (APT) family kinase protein
VDGDAELLSDQEIRLLETEVLHARVRAVTALTESVRSKAVRLRTDDGDFVLTENIRGNSAPVEAALMRRVAPIVPVPPPVHADDGELLGRPFVLKRFVPGQTLASALRDTSATDARQIAYEVGATLAAIGSVRFDRPGEFADVRLDPHPHPDFDLMALPRHVERRLDGPTVAEHLDTAQRARLLRIVARDGAMLAAVADQARLVHSDFNGKNLVVRHDGSLRVAAVLDWEFAFSGPPLVDVANHLRWPDDLPESYVDGFRSGFTDAGGILDADWERLTRVLDMFALADFLAAGPRHVSFPWTLRRMKEIIARGFV